MQIDSLLWGHLLANLELYSALSSPHLNSHPNNSMSELQPEASHYHNKQCKAQHRYYCWFILQQSRWFNQHVPSEPRHWRQQPYWISIWGLVNWYIYHSQLEPPLLPSLPVNRHHNPEELIKKSTVGSQKRKSKERNVHMAVLNLNYEQFTTVLFLLWSFQWGQGKKPSVQK